MNNRIEIPLSKKKIALLLLASIAFVAGGIWIASDPERFIPNIFGVTNPEIIRISGIIGILFFGAAGIYGIKKLFDKKVGLIIDSNGITDNSNASSIGLIEWNDISDIRTKQVMSTKFLLIDIVNPEKYIEKAKNKLQAKLMKGNMNMYKTPLSITSNTLKFDFGELEKLIQTEFKRNKNAR
ncbi:STM3941 family protein [uncultured Algibacter sp.]|uniref:STM3941 family protein n=1 Tax=uncultured Algibacter sp. TaxID=298659 RepID=UPI002638BFE3|nr:STM3941 family protein [uncultured Algibacter sp.]